MPILIRGYLKKNESDAKKVRKLIKDILTAIRRRRQWTVSSNARDAVAADKRGVSRNPDSFEIEACEVEFEAQYFTRKFNAEA
jgi:hypothetical protein